MPEFTVISCKSCVLFFSEVFCVNYCFRYIFIIPSKCLKYSDTFCYVWTGFRISDAKYCPANQKCRELYFQGEVMIKSKKEYVLNTERKIWSWKRSLEIMKKCHFQFFLGTHKADNFTDIVADLIQSYKAMRCDMFSKVLFLYCLLDLFLENLRTLNDEHGERFHKDISTMERRYQGEWTPSILVDYCCTLRRAFHWQNVAANHSVLHLT